MSDALTVRPPSALDTLLSDPERLKEFPIETVERMFALNREMAADAARREFTVAFNRLQSRMTPVHKAATNTHTASRYVLAEHVHAMLAPLLHEEGFAWSSSMGDCPTPGHLRIVLTLRHIGGHVETHFYDAPVDDKGIKGAPTKTALHGSRSTWTYCERTLLSKVCGIRETLDDDGNAGGNVGPGSERITEEQAQTLDELIDEVQANRVRFLSLYGVESIADLPASVYVGALRALEAKRS